MTAMQRRTALRLIGSGVGISILAACTPAPSTTPPPATVSGTRGAPATAAPAANAAAQPKSGGTLRIGAAADVNRLDPHFRLGDIYYQVYDRLTQYDQSHTPQPMLAESWDVSNDFTEIKFVLRKGVQFHNGREMDAAAVKFNSERARDLPNTQLDEAKWWTAIETPDKYTVLFKSDKPRPTAFDFFEYLNIAEPATADDPKQAIGTGPYKYVEWLQNTSLKLTKNPNYWMSGRPYMDDILMSVVTDPQAMVARFEAGDFDAATLPANDMIRLRDGGNYVGYSYSAGNFAVLGIQCQTPPWDTKKARQALQFAVDRERWANTINRGLEVPSALPWAKSSPAYDEQKSGVNKFDIDKAKSLLQAAGVNSPLSQELVLSSGMAEYTAFAQVIQNDLAKLGITVSIKVQDSAAYLETVNNWRYQGFWLGGGSFAHLDPTTAFVKSRALSVSGNSSAFTKPVNEAAVALVERGLSEADPAKRKQIYVELNDMLLDESYVIGMSPTTSKLMTTKKVHDLAPTLHSGQKWWDVWLG